MTASPPADEWRAALRRRLTSAMKARDTTAVGATRSLIAAIDNAEAVDAADAPSAEGRHLAGGVAGVGAAEVARRQLTAGEVEAIVKREIEERRASAADYERLGEREAAARLLAEIAVLEAARP